MEPRVKLNHETEQGQSDKFTSSKETGGVVIAEAKGQGILIHPKYWSASVRRSQSFSLTPQRAEELIGWLCWQLEEVPASPVTTKHVIALEIEWAPGAHIPDKLSQSVERAVALAIDGDSFSEYAKVATVTTRSLKEEDQS